MLVEKQLKELLEKVFNIDKKEIKAYIQKAEKNKKTLEQLIIDDGIVDELELYTEVAKANDVPIVALRGKEIQKEILNLIPPPMAQTHSVVAFDRTKTEIHVAMLDPDDIQTIEFIERKTGLVPKVFLTTPSDIKDALKRYHADLESDIQITMLKEGDDTAVKDLKKAAEELPIINIVNSILEHAVYEGASDIHIEPEEKEVTVRYRVDGILRNVMSLPKNVKNGITARIKILTNLKIDEHMIPQDGRFKINIQDERLAFRVSTLPVYEGEKIVMRILHESQKPLTLDQLGLLPEPRKLVEKAIVKPHGMILVTGPTGSGKTTTLYSILGILNKASVNISTIEDPIEYHVQGINQSQVNPRVGFTFASGLRSLLRQDPNIIMVGEIRDQETAEIAVHSAMTGHLVLSTLHTNDAATTLPRLTDMGVAPFLIAFTANIVMAQRLVRKICEHCKKEIKLDEVERESLKQLLGTFNIANLLKNQKISLKPQEQTLENIIFYHGEGCRRCNNSGYKGRIGIYEVLEIDKDIIAKINTRATAAEIGDYAKKRGMVTMFQDGLVKAKMGITTIEEVLRVTMD